LSDIKNANKNISLQKLELTPNDNDRISKLNGPLNKNIQKIEQFFGVTINQRGNLFEIIGLPKCVRKSALAINQLYDETAENNLLSPQNVMLTLKTLDQDYSEEDKNIQALLIASTIKTQNKSIKPRTRNQMHFIQSINSHDINFGIGPAGTGKTFLAVACAVAALEKEQVKRIVLTRPAVEAGENLGFLPGDIDQKIDPYLRPLYDALYQILGTESIKKLIEKGVIEIAPLAFMRGRTLNDSFIIIDEAQNSTKEQMKMFLTRIGFGSKAVVVGDVTQVDLVKKSQNGLRNAINILKSIKAIKFNFFTSKDVVRHSLVQKIIEAYDLKDE
jgi:phosphate starvation-inducible protein PhoH and related proteins